MSHAWFVISSLPLLFSLGCGGNQGQYARVNTSLFESTSIQHQPMKLEPTEATKEMAQRVQKIGDKLARASASSKDSVLPMFNVIGAPQSALFHRTPNMIFITEGLAQKCKDDAELSALLAYQMGQLVSEREALAKPARQARSERLPPIDVPIGNDVGGGFGPADGTRMMELARYERERKSFGNALPPDPEMLAKGYLKNAGYQEDTLESVAPLLREAHKNVVFEKQLKAQPN